MKLVATFTDSINEGNYNPKRFKNHIPFEYESLVDAEDDFNEQLNSIKRKILNDEPCNIELGTLKINAHNFYVGRDHDNIHHWTTPEFRTLDDWFTKHLENKQ